MLRIGHFHVQNSKMTAQGHLYQLSEYKLMMHQAVRNNLINETSLYQVLLALNLYT